MQYPRFKNGVQACTLATDLVCLVSETDYLVLEGRLYPLLAPYITGHNSVEDIIDCLAGRATALDVRFGLATLQEHACLSETGDTESDAAHYFGESTTQSSLEQTTVSVIAVGAIDTHPLISLLQATGIRVDRDGDFAIVLTDDYLNEELRQISRTEMTHGRPWMMVKPVGLVVSAGPTFEPPKTACWTCLEQRLRETPRGRIITASGVTIAPGPTLPSSFQVVIGMAASATVQWLARRKEPVIGSSIVTCDTRVLQFTTHPVVRREGCPQCGEQRTDVKQPVLRSQRKLFMAEGSHSSDSAEAVYRKYECHISALTGIVDGVRAEHTREGSPVCVFSAGHNFSLRHDTSPLFRRSLGARSAGKGVTPAQARTSALCEALERYSGLFRGAEPRISASLSNLGPAAIHPHACMQFSPAQFDRRDDWNKRESEFNWVPQRFQEELEVEWVAVWSLTTSEFRYLPAAYCYYNYPTSPNHDFCRADSNGCAAGANLEDAILHGFMEVVERDCVAVWWYNRLRRPVVDLSSFHQPYFNSLQAYYQEAGRDLWTLDISSDLGIPVIAAISRGPKGDWILGFGAHLEARLAISHALTEMNQFLPSALEGCNHMIATSEIADPSFLLPDDKLQPVHAGTFATQGSGDLRIDIERCVALAQERGLEVLVLDQTRADVGLTVVKVVVPHMRQFWARFGPGRLYDVPVHMGWLPCALRESDLNPAHLVI